VTEETTQDEQETISGELSRLTEEVASLRAEVRRTSAAALPRLDDPGWDTPPASHAWVSSLATPTRPPLRVPRLPFELAFIAGAAVLAGVADLRPIEIAAVMALAWVVVALAELAGSRGDRMRMQLFLAEPLMPRPQPQQPTVDPAWFAPPVEHTLMGGSDDQATVVGTLPPLQEAEDEVSEDEATGIAKLPPPVDDDAVESDDVENTAEHRAET
jgi:hypothetical protein